MNPSRGDGSVGGGAGDAGGFGVPGSRTSANRLQKLKRQQWLLGVICTLAVLGVWRMGWLDRAELPTLDWRSQWFHRWAGGASKDIVVMGIDDRAIREIGPWPWDRAVMAAGLDELRVAGARTVALDLLLNNERSEEGDAALARAMTAQRAVGGVVLPFRSGSIDDEGGRLLRRVLGDEAAREAVQKYPDDVAAALVRKPLLKQEADEDVVLEAISQARALLAVEERASLKFADAGETPDADDVGMVAPIPAFVDAAALLGDVGIGGFDGDDVYRRFSVWSMEEVGRLWPSFSLAAVLQHLGVGPDQVRVTRRGSRGDIEIPAEQARRIRTANHGPSGRAWEHLVTWPRGGRGWQGQFEEPTSDPKRISREVTLFAALEPWAVKQATATNLVTLGELIALAQRLNLGDYQEIAESIKEFRAVPMDAREWQAGLERVSAGATKVAAAAADFVEFAGGGAQGEKVNLEELTADEARTYLEHVDVATKIPLILEETRNAPARVEAARVRLRNIAYGKLVFVGWTATGAVADRVNTSVGPATPGVYIHAAAASSFLTGFARTPVHTLVDVLGVLLMGVAGIAAARRVAVWLAPMLLAALIGAWFLVAGVVFWDAGWAVLAVAAPSAAAGVSWSGVMLHRLLVEQRMRRRTEERFRAYVSPAVVDELVNNPELDSMTPQRRELTIMFCDVAGFTAIAERLGAEGTARFLSSYLGRMTDTLLRHGATIDKYLGDGIMAFWGAPMREPRHVRHACRAAVALARAVAEVGASGAVHGAPEGVKIRIGLASGEVMVGDFGNPPIRSSYTVLGDACNIAARLERGCKALGVTILVSAAVRAAAGDGFVWRSLGEFLLHGRKTPEMLFELVGMEGAQEQTASRGHLVATWIAATDAAVEAFRAGRLDEARERFVALRDDFGDEKIAALYLRAIERGGGMLELDEE